MILDDSDDDGDGDYPDRIRTGLLFGYRSVFVIQPVR